MGAALLAAIERLRKAPFVVLALLFVSAVGGLAQFTGATKSLIGLVRPHHPDPRGELAKLGVGFTSAAMAKAAADGDERVVDLLLESGMPVEAAPDPATPPLMLAAQAGSVKIIRRLLAAGADPARSGAAGSALDYAVRYRHPEVAALLLMKALPQPVLRNGFVTAGELGDVPSLRLIAPHLQDVRTAAGVALHAIARDASDRPQTAQAIGAVAAFHPDLNALDINRQTLLHIGVNEDSPVIVAALLKAGANPNVLGRCQTPPDEPMQTPLACAAVRGTSDGLTSVTTLVAAHADPEARGPHGATPLMLAAGNGDAAITSALLQAGANRNAKDATGRTALDYARTARHNDPGGARAALRRPAAPPRS